MNVDEPKGGGLVAEGTITDADLERFAVDDPRRFGNYELRRKLGVGGMAETVLAVRRGPGGFQQEVCLKRILPAFALDDRFLEMFLGEARLAARLRHNNVVQVYDFGEEQGVYYLALEFVDGLDLRALLTELKRSGKRLDPKLLVYIVYELLAALAYAHDLEIDGSTAGVVHRDVTPSNVLVSIHGEVKLTDFGIAKATHSSNATQTGSVKGKIPYMAPEQAQGQRVDKRTDLFAVGVILYEALTGQRPFDGPTDTATLLNIARGIYTPIEELEPSVHPSLRALVDKLLRRDPDERVQSAQEAADCIVDLVPPPVVRRTVSALVAQLQEGSAAHAVGPTLVAEELAKNARRGKAAPSTTTSGVRASEDLGPPAPRIAETLHLSTADLEPASLSALPPATRLRSAADAGQAAIGGQRRESEGFSDEVVLPLPALSATVARGLAFLGGAGVVLLLLLGVLWTSPYHPWRDGPEEASRSETPAPTAAAGARKERAGGDALRATATALAVIPAPRAHPSATAPASAVEAPGPQSPPSTEGRETPHGSATPSAAGPAAPAPSAAAPTDPADTPRATTRASSDRRGYLRVYVIPYGSAWIDGRRVTAGQFVGVSPGTHVIRAGRGEPVETRTVQVAQGQRRDVQFTLRAPPNADP